MTSRHRVDVGIVRVAEPGCADDHMRAMFQGCEDVRFGSIRLRVRDEDVTATAQRLVCGGKDW